MCHLLIGGRWFERDRNCCLPPSLFKPLTPAINQKENSDIAQAFHVFGSCSPSRWKLTNPLFLSFAHKILSLATLTKNHRERETLSFFSFPPTLFAFPPLFFFPISLPNSTLLRVRWKKKKFYWKGNRIRSCLTCTFCSIKRQKCGTREQFVTFNLSGHPFASRWKTRRSGTF